MSLPGGIVDGAEHAPPPHETSGTAARVVRNGRRSDWNTCGQAAIASLLAHFHAGPFAGGASPDDGAAIDRVAAEFGPDLPWGLGTSVWRIAAALRRHDLDCDVVHTGWFGHGLRRALDRVTVHAARGIPVPVCLDDGRLGGRPWAAHWAIVLRVSEAHVTLGNAGRAELPLDRFLAAWRCRHLPPPYHHCAVLAF